MLPEVILNWKCTHNSHFNLHWKATDLTTQDSGVFWLLSHVPGQLLLQVVEVLALYLSTVILANLAALKFCLLCICRLHLFTFGFPLKILHLLLQLLSVDLGCFLLLPILPFRFLLSFNFYAMLLLLALRTSSLPIGTLFVPMGVLFPCSSPPLA